MMYSQEKNMDISNLTFIVTDDCNFDCSYCPQKKEKKTITNETIRTAVEFFYPFFTREGTTQVGFYGGEPLLAFDKIQYAAALLHEKNKTGAKKIQFRITTNGSLLTDQALEFFDKNRFALLLSFDGLAQDKGRKKNSLESTLQVMKRIQAYPGISFEINSVFSPWTIGTFYESIRFIIEQKGPDITFNFNTLDEWSPSDFEMLRKEMDRLREYTAAHYKKTGHIPVKNFRSPVSKPDVFRCSAGINHMAVTPGGELWGCFLFHDFFKTRKDHPQYHDYFFGELAHFTSSYESLYPTIVKNYRELRQDFFQAQGKDCFLCTDLKECAVCPIIAAYSTGSLGKIPCSKCELGKIARTLL